MLTKQEQEILDNAPEGATDVQECVCGVAIYWRLIPYFAFKYVDSDWVEVEEMDLISTRSLADIRRIVELEEAAQAQRMRAFK